MSFSVKPGLAAQRITALLAVLLCVSCSSSATAPAYIGEFIERHPPQVTAYDPSQQHPLTGVRGTPVQRAAIAVKVENSREARPHRGLDYADIIYEELVEGGITRFVAVFQSQTPPNGVMPVRSIRAMDGPIAAPLRGLIAYSGGQHAYSNRARDLGLQLLSMDYGASGFSRDKYRPSPHDVIGDFNAWYAEADENHQTPPDPVFQYAYPVSQNTARALGTPATLLDVEFSSYEHPHWVWDATTQSYLRFEKDEPFLLEDGQQFSATNVVVINVAVEWIGVPETVVLGSGSGHLLTDGYAVPITWSKPAWSEQMTFQGPDGNPIYLTPGNTWIELVPHDFGGSYTIS
ncbi:MAG: DUF3048 domain-containing protein [Propionibacteriaceae bacterium]|jgi:hypothetical protein|nr:DUF3048 domain-containing protein [Propionibacteriaceae bacterium]